MLKDRNIGVRESCAKAQIRRHGYSETGTMDMLDMLGMGALVAGCDKGSGLATSNRVYLNLWPRSDSAWINTGVRHVPSRTRDDVSSEVLLFELGRLADRRPIERGRPVDAVQTDDPGLHPQD